MDYWKYLLLISVIVVPNLNSSQPKQITIGAIFEKNSFYNERMQMLQYAVDEANDKLLSSSDIRLAITTETITYGREYLVQKRVCNLLKLGVGVLFGPRSKLSTFEAINICSRKGIPYINVNTDEEGDRNPAVLNMNPTFDKMNHLLIKVMDTLNWKRATILYESSHRQVAEMLEMNKRTGKRINVRNLKYTKNFGFGSTLLDVRNADETNIILECSSESLPIIFRQAMQFGLMNKHYQWIIANINMPIDIRSYLGTGVSLTFYNVLDSNHATFSQDISGTIIENDDLYGDIGPESRWNLENSLNCIKSSAKIAVYPEKLNFEIGTVEGALIYDAVMVFAKAIGKLKSEQITPVPILCDDDSSFWNMGDTIINEMKKTKYDALSGRVEFDQMGVRSNVTINFGELTMYGPMNSGDWTDGSRNSEQKVAVPKLEFIDYTMKNRKLIIITAEANPYTKFKSEATGNDRFEGYAIDLIIELSSILGFEYEFVLEEDVSHGYGKYNSSTEKWSGMIGKVLSGDADIVIGDLTVTDKRSMVLDFTPSIMHSGIVIMYKIPQRVAPSMFSFMAPFSTMVWILLGCAYLFVSISIFVLARISSSQWELRPYPCVEEPKYLYNQFSFQNSLWFTAGALLQQGSEIEAKAASVRLAAAVWWFFTLVIVESYTANLASFLSAEYPVQIIKSIEDFKDCGLPNETECKALFGAKRGGATFKFFEGAEDFFKGCPDCSTTYQHMYEVMKKNPNLLVDNYTAGTERVVNQNYAFLMEAASLEYYTKLNCNVTQVGDWINEHEYAIGMRKGYEYYDTLSIGVLELRKNGVLDRLYKKWWEPPIGEKKCPVGLFPSDETVDKKVETINKEQTGIESLTLEHLKGVFLILACGSIFAFLCGIISFVWAVYRQAQEAKITFKQELKMGTKILLKSLADPSRPKPVRFRKKQPPIYQLSNLNSLS